MCQLTVKQELGELLFAVTALGQLAGSPGSFERENAQNAARGINARLCWCREQVEKQENLGSVLAPKAPDAWSPASPEANS